jgi:hypothetical protein
MQDFPEQDGLNRYYKLSTEKRTGMKFEKKDYQKREETGDLSSINLYSIEIISLS